MNFKTNKTKLIARVMLLVLLVTSTFSFVGCDMKYKYILSEKYYNIFIMPHSKIKNEK